MRVKSLGEINRHRQHAESGTELVGRNPGLYYVEEGGGRIRWSGLDGSHAGWMKEEVIQVLVAKGISGL